MVGVVVTGHGGFAAGMAANVKMLAGSDAEVKAVDFADGMDVEVFEKQLAEAIDSYADCEAVLVLADIAGGTPYNRAAGLSMTRPKVRVISGLNSSMLMDLCMRNITGDECPGADALAMPETPEPTGPAPRPRRRAPLRPAGSARRPAPRCGATGGNT